jgi:hypothetical protein
MGFSVGQTINIDDGRHFETAIITSIARAPGARGGPAGGPGRGPAGTTIMLAGPLMFAHVAGVQVSGDGISLTAPLAKAHAAGAQVTAGVPTPGAPNRYFSRRR